MSSTTGIYGIIHRESGKIYVGSAVNTRKRFYNHKWALSRGSHSNKHLQAAWNKYGEIAFEFKILEFVHSPTSLVWREQFYLDYYRSYDREFGYNIRHKAEANYGLVPSAETRKKIGDGNRGKVVSKATCEKISQALIGHSNPKSQEFRKQVSNKLKGIPKSDETKKRMSVAQIGKIPSCQTRLLWSQQRKGKRVGKNNPFFGKKHSPETIEKCRQAAIEQNNKRRNS